MQLLKVNNLHASYEGVSAVQGVTLVLDEAEIVGLCGPNKAGKSTLCKCLAGSKSPDNGELIFNGRDITSVPTSRRIQFGLSLCPEGRGIYSEMSVKDNLRVGSNGISAREEERKRNHILSYFPILSERLNQQAGTLSGGEAQMLGIAKKLMRMPRLLVVDEPSLGLSPNSVRAVFQTLAKVRDEFGVSILLVEEAITRLSGWVDRVYVMNRGALVSQGKIKEIINSAAVSSAFAGELDEVAITEKSDVERKGSYA